MKNGLWLVIFVLLMTPLWCYQAEKLSPELQARLSRGGDEIPVNILLTDQYPDLRGETLRMTRTVGRAEAIRRLQDFTAASQSPLLAELRTQTAANVEGLWIANVVCCSLTPDMIRDLSDRSDIQGIELDALRPMLPDEASPGEVSGDRAIGWHITKVNADDAWALGYDGTGVLLALIDTGVNYNHHDLMDHMWNGGTAYPNHGYDFINNDNDPIDDNGHGTCTAGIAAGDGTAGNQTGIAPNATVMSLKIVLSNGYGRESAFIRAVQFAIEHNADVISMSLGFTHSGTIFRNIMRIAMENLLAANVPIAVAAGNEGGQQATYPIPDNVRCPGDCPPPWLHPDQTLTGGLSAVITCGNTTSTDAIYASSSRGPVTWQSIGGYGDYAYSPGIGLIDPDVCAPGATITTTTRTSVTGYQTMTGTSASTPCVAGVIALLLQKNPSLTPGQIDQTLETTAAHLSASKSNTFGSGRIDALAALGAIAAIGSTPGVVSSPYPVDGDTGVLIPIRLTWASAANATSYRVYIGTDNPPTNLAADVAAENCNDTLTNALAPGSTCYWRVDARNGGQTTTGPVWSFTAASSPEETFESGGLHHLAWQSGGAALWSIASGVAYQGSYSAVSGDVTDSVYTWLGLQKNATSPGWVGFYVKTSSESDWDYFNFYIDGVRQTVLSGETDWTPCRFHVAAGLHTYIWSFEKDTGGSVGSDCCWIDNIHFPPEMVPYTPGDILISEISDENASSANEGAGFLEIYNNAGEPLSLDGLELIRGTDSGGFTADGTTFTIPVGTTVQPGVVVVIGNGADAMAFASAWGLPDAGNYLSGDAGLGLTDSGRAYRLQARDVRGAVLDTSPTVYAGERFVQYEPGAWSAALPADGATPGQDDLDPTLPVELSSFTAFGGASVTLNWTVQSETDMLGYHVYRGETDDLTLACPSGALIPATNDTGTHPYGYSIQEPLADERYWLEMIGMSGSVRFAGPVLATGGDPEPGEVPEIALVTGLNPNYPNPFNPSTRLIFTLAEPGRAALTVHDVRGRLVRRFDPGICSAGRHTVSWDGRDRFGVPCASGVYLIELRVGEQAFLRNSLLLK
jgi:subtilisin family serine protease